MLNVLHQGSCHCMLPSSLSCADTSHWPGASSVHFHLMLTSKGSVSSTTHQHISTKDWLCVAFADLFFFSPSTKINTWRLTVPISWSLDRQQEVQHVADARTVRAFPGCIAPGLCWNILYHKKNKLLPSFLPSLPTPAACQHFLFPWQWVHPEAVFPERRLIVKGKGQGVVRGCVLRKSGTTIASPVEASQRKSFITPA